MMIRRFSTTFIDFEDRILLKAEFEDLQTLHLWLTQRLLNNLLPNLCGLLERQVGTTKLAEVKQEFAQQKARAELAPQPPVRTEPDVQGVLIHSVDLKTTNAGMGLQFKDADGNEVASLQLQPKPLRQWLNIVYDQYRRAHWPSDVWPAWVAEARPAQVPARAVVLH